MSTSSCRHRVAGEGEGADLSLQGDRLGREVPWLDGVFGYPWSPRHRLRAPGIPRRPQPAGAWHVARSASISRPPSRARAYCPTNSSPRPAVRNLTSCPIRSTTRWPESEPEATRVFGRNAQIAATCQGAVSGWNRRRGRPRKDRRRLGTASGPCGRSSLSSGRELRLHEQRWTTFRSSRFIAWSSWAT